MQLYPLINKKRKRNLENKLKIIKSIVIPTATYAGEIWHQASDTLKSEIQKCINTIIRMTAGSPFYITNKKL